MNRFMRWIFQHIFAELSTIQIKLGIIHREIIQVSKEADDIKAAVANIQASVAKAAATLDELAALAKAGNVIDPTELESLAGQLNAAADSLNATVANDAPPPATPPAG